MRRARRSKNAEAFLNNHLQPDFIKEPISKVSRRKLILKKISADVRLNYSLTTAYYGTKKKSTTSSGDGLHVSLHTFLNIESDASVL